MSDVTLKIILSFFIGGLIGLERGKHGRAAGMRTHILVCTGSALAASIGLFVSSSNPGLNIDPTRIAAQIVASIGVLGAGSIMIRNRDIITGLTTAAGLWASGIIGLAIGFGFFEGAVVASIVVLISIAMLNYFEISKLKEIRLYIETNDIKKINNVMEKLDSFVDSDVSFSITSPRTNINNNVGIYFRTHMKKGLDHKKVVRSLEEKILKVDSVLYVVEDF